MFHKHNYKETHRTFAAPHPDGFSLKGCSPSEGERYYFGVTAIERKCSCGGLRLSEVLGDAR